MEAVRLGLRPGDILVYKSKAPGHEAPSAAHIAIAATDEKYIVHNTINTGAKFAGAAKHAVASAAKDWVNPGREMSIEVYRLSDAKPSHEPIAREAARYAEMWSDSVVIDSPNPRSRDQANPDFERAASEARAKHLSNTERAQARDAARSMAGKPDKPHTDHKAFTAQMNPFLAGKDLAGAATDKSPYSAGRLERGQQTPAEGSKWSQASAFRAIKAYVRACEKQGLSPRHGTSCDQFVMYCYQAASVKSMVGSSLLDSDMIELVSKRSSDIKLYVSKGQIPQDLGSDLKTKSGEAFDRLRQLLEKMTGDSTCSGWLPQEMASDAKTSSVTKLFDKVTAQDSGFRRVGFLDANGAVTDTAPQAEARKPAAVAKPKASPKPKASTPQPNATTPEQKAATADLTTSDTGSS